MVSNRKLQGCFEWCSTFGQMFPVVQSTYYSRVESFWDFFLFGTFYDIWSDLVRKNSDNWVKLMVDFGGFCFSGIHNISWWWKVEQIYGMSLEFFTCFWILSSAFSSFNLTNFFCIWKTKLVLWIELKLLLVSCQLDFSASFQGWLVSDPQFFSFPWWLLQDVELFCYSEKRVRQRG